MFWLGLKLVGLVSFRIDKKGKNINARQFFCHRVYVDVLTKETFWIFAFDTTGVTDFKQTTFSHESHFFTLWEPY